MTNKIITTIAAASIALTGMSATSAEAADAGDVFAALVGIAALAALANNANRTTTTVSTTSHPHTGTTHVHRHNPPSKCLRQRYAHGGWKKYFSHKCLAKVGYVGSHPHF